MEPALVWGLFTRLMGTAFAVSLLALARQVRWLAGSRGLNPYQASLRAAWRDFGAKALLKWPSVLWLGAALPPWAADALLVAVPAAGGLAGAAVAALGGAAPLPTPLLFAIAWASLLSVDAGATALVYPWDSFLLEAGFLSIWLPAAAPSLSASTALPLPLLAFCFRYVLWRLLLGFGKMKFVGATNADVLYVKGFSINQPIATPAAWLAYAALPDWFWRLSLRFMWAAEIIIPFGLFIPGWPRLAAGGATLALMAGIQVSGNFGYFNALTAVLAVPALDAQSSLLGLGGLSAALDWAVSPSTPASHLAFTVLFICYLSHASLLYFAMNSWVNLSFTHWGTLVTMKPAWLFKGYVSFLRALAPFRLVQGYGVFPPNAAPAQRWAVLYQARPAAVPRETSKGSSTAPRDPEEGWLSLPFPAQTGALRFVAPYHPRFDHAVFYEALGMNGTNLLCTLGHHSPYAFAPGSNPWLRLQAALARAALPLPAAFGDGQDALGGLALPPAFDGLVQAQREALAPLLATNGGLLLPASAASPSSPSSSVVSSSIAPPGYVYEGPAGLEVRAVLVNVLHAADVPLSQRKAPVPSVGEVARWWATGGSVASSRSATDAGWPTAWGLGPRDTAADAVSGPVPWHATPCAVHLPSLVAAHVCKDPSSGARVLVADPAFLSLARPNAAPSGPEAWWSETPFYRTSTASGLTTNALSRTHYEEVWTFVAFVRRAAAEAAAAAAATTAAPAAGSPTAATSGNVPPGHISALRAIEATHVLVPTPAAVLTAAAAAVTAATPVPAKAKGSAASGSAAPALPCSLLCPSNAAQFDAEVVALSLRGGAEKAAASAAAGPVPVAAADAVFCWATLPQVAAAVAAAYDPLHLARIRCSLALMTLPLRRVAEKVFWRTPPPPGAAAQEWNDAGLPSEGNEEAAAAYARIGEAISGAPAAPRGTPPAFPAAAADASAAAAGMSDAASSSSPLPLCGHEYKRSVFAANDDAGWSGSMSSHFRHASWADWLVLVRGRAAYESVVLGQAVSDDSHSGVKAATAEQLAGVLFDRPLVLGTAPTPAARDRVTDTPAPALFAMAGLGSDNSPAQVASEAGSYLLALTNWDAFAGHAQTARQMGAQGRPSLASSPPPPLGPLPGFLSLMPRLAAHAILATPCRPGTSYPGAASQPMTRWDSVHRRPIAPLALADWAFDPVSGAWVLVSAPTSPLGEAERAKATQPTHKKTENDEGAAALEDEPASSPAASPRPRRRRVGA